MKTLGVIEALLQNAVGAYADAGGPGLPIVTVDAWLVIQEGPREVQARFAPRQVEV